MILPRAHGGRAATELDGKHIVDCKYRFVQVQEPIQSTSIQVASLCSLYITLRSNAYLSCEIWLFSIRWLAVKQTVASLGTIASSALRLQHCCKTIVASRASPAYNLFVDACVLCLISVAPYLSWLLLALLLSSLIFPTTRDVASWSETQAFRTNESPRQQTQRRRTRASARRAHRRWQKRRCQSTSLPGI